MNVYALSGPSGTGKSTSSLFFAHEKGIPAIIDDGLLIYKGKRVAGTSAKFEKNYITAIKRATFHSEKHRKEVKQAIKRLNIKKILIIGTSKRMVDKIAETLNIGPINHYFDVTDVRSSSEIKMALFVRQTQGKHVIPVPHAQVEQNFFSKLVTKGKKIFSPKSEFIGETTIVYPDFTKGIIHISNKVLRAIIKKECEDFKEVKECRHVAVHMFGLPIIHIHVRLHYPFPRSIRDIGTDIQQKISDSFHEQMGLETQAIHVHIE
ncbi:MAG TPA: hypothetical protein GX525_05675 [Bacilli bacterium]|nr:hypothetical protein [Bacilli bacterium]